MVDVAPDVGFQRSWCPQKAYDTFFLKVMDLREVELGFERYGPANRGRWSVFGSPEGNFLIKIPARPGKILVIRELHVMSERVLFLKLLTSNFDDLGIPGNLAIPSFLRFRTCAKASLGKLLTIRELRIVAEVTLFLKVSHLQTKLLWVGKNLCANVAP
uniref:Uncharacterized protein n=1 Tax=Fagus sylvatica TaxID=28930 RepID=A0A2N9H555_FAGSY